MEIVVYIIVAVAVAFIVSAGAGTWASYDAPKPNSDEAAADKCAVCKAEQEWYESLSALEQVAYFGWWVARGAVCAAKGC